MAFRIRPASHKLQTVDTLPLGLALCKELVYMIRILFHVPLSPAVSSPGHSDETYKP